MALVPPVQKDAFSYAGDSLYCEASNLNRHRRATLPELQNHFNSKDTENRPAHWYEAQLIHYGLPPSKVKGTAHKRLFDAVMGGGLAVPPRIQKIEADLKKEWTKKERTKKERTKKEREAKKMLKEFAAAKPPAKGTKRKADQVSTSTSVNVNVNVSVSSTGVIEVSAAQPAAKNAKAAPKTTAVKEKKVTPTTKPDAATTAPKEKKATAKKTTATSTTVRADKTTTAKPKAPASVPKEKKATAPKTTAKEKKAAPAKSTTATAKPAKPAAKAKGAASKTAQQPNPASVRPQGEDGDAPPPYSEYDPAFASGWSGSQQPISPSSPQRRIGLLNGRYNVSCPHVEYNFLEHKDNLYLIATLDGSTLWLKFELGVATGMMKVERPYEVNADHPVRVLWRGNALVRGSLEYELFTIDTDDRAGSFNGMFFMGEGHIHGFIRYGAYHEHEKVELEFDAYPQPNQSTTSEISTTQARQIWASLEGDRY